jgi:hypothetical protein
VRHGLLPWQGSPEQEMRKLIPKMSQSWEAAFGMKLNSPEYKKAMEKTIEGFMAMRS